MNTFRQLFRQPLKLISGIVVVALAVSILCVCIGQSIAADKTEATMERHFTTIALMTHAHRYEEREVELFNGEVIKYKAFMPQVPEEIVELISTIAKERTDLVQTVANQGLASAYISSLIPDNYCNYQYQNPLFGTAESKYPHDQEGYAPYADAMLEITVETVEITNHFIMDGVKEDGTDVSFERELLATVTGSIERIISLKEGWDDPIGKTIILSLTLQSLEDFEKMDLEEGGRYLVSGTDYEDGNWMLKGRISQTLSEHGINVSWQDIDIDRVRELQDGDPTYITSIPIVAVYEQYLDKDHPDYRKGLIPLTESITVLKNAVLMNVTDSFTDGEYAYIRHENGAYPTMDYTRYITDENGNKIQITEE